MNWFVKNFNLAFKPQIKRNYLIQIIDVKYHVSCKKIQQQDNTYQKYHIKMTVVVM